MAAKIYFSHPLPSFIPILSAYSLPNNPFVWANMELLVLLRYCIFSGILQGSYSFQDEISYLFLTLFTHILNQFCMKICKKSFLLYRIIQNILHFVWMNCARNSGPIFSCFFFTNFSILQSFLAPYLFKALTKIWFLTCSRFSLHVETMIDWLIDWLIILLT